MKEAVVIKSYQNGITLMMNKEASFDQILEELAYKFSEGRNFFGKTNMALSLEGRYVSDSEEIRIIETIRENCSVNIICVVGRDDETDHNFVKAVQQIELMMTKSDQGQFYKGSLKSKEVLETENSIIILGDVHPGAAVISSKSIIVLGGLYGEAYAGGNGQENSYIIALEMEPERIKIGDFKYKTNEKAKWSIKHKVQPKIAYIKNKKLVFEPLTKDLPGSF